MVNYTKPAKAAVATPYVINYVHPNRPRNAVRVLQKGESVSLTQLAAKK